MRLLLIPITLAVAGGTSLIVAVFTERRMNRHRQPGVTYAQVTLRRDGGWRRADLFTAKGLQYQRGASRYGLAGALLLVMALIAWGAIAWIS